MHIKKLVRDYYKALDTASLKDETAGLSAHTGVSLDPYLVRLSNLAA